MFGAALTHCLFLPAGASVVWLDTPVKAALDDYEPLMFHNVYVEKVKLDWRDARCRAPGKLFLCLLYTSDAADE